MAPIAGASILFYIKPYGRALESRSHIPLETLPRLRARPFVCAPRKRKGSAEALPHIDSFHPQAGVDGRRPNTPAARSYSGANARTTFPGEPFCMPI